MRDIVRLVMGQAAVIAAIGLAVGVATGLAAARALSSMLYGVPPWDPLAIAAAGSLLTVTALGASYLPARRARRVWIRRARWRASQDSRHFCAS